MIFARKIFETGQKWDSMFSEETRLKAMAFEVEVCNLNLQSKHIFQNIQNSLVKYEQILHCSVDIESCEERTLFSATKHRVVRTSPI